jgi:hypothetical protein
MDDLMQRLEELKAQSVDFQIVSKNMGNRQWCLNQILRRMRDKAVFVDTAQGIEYGWLFRFTDIYQVFHR